MPDETQNEFLADLEPKEDQDPFETPIVAAPVEETAEDPEEGTNRRERRLRAKLQAERESSIALAARLDALTEAQKLSRETEPEMDETISRIYGTNTPEAAEATKLLQKALSTAQEKAVEKALDRLREEQREQQESVAKEERTLDEMVDEIEDEYNTTLDEPTKKSFYTLLERMSPKDENGEVKDYADYHAVWEELRSRRQAQPNRAKDLASRSSLRGSSPSTSVEQNSTERWLKEQGII